MYLSKKQAPVNSLVFISDVEGGEPPLPVRGSNILSTSSCISVVTYPENEGATEFILGPIADVDPATAPDFSGSIETPTRHLRISTVEDQPILKIPVPNTLTQVCVWLSHSTWPDKIIVGWS